jgi:hypothetical protein
MKKYIILFLVAFVATFSACKDAPTVQLTVGGVLSSTKTWRIQSGSFGDEQLPIDLYGNFRISFNGKNYSTINPDNRIFLGSTFSASGTWSESTTERGINFTNGTSIWFAKEVSRFLTPNNLTLEYVANEPGKPATKYTFVLVAE